MSGSVSPFHPPLMFIRSRRFFLIFGVVICIANLWIFYALARDVTTNGPIVQFDKTFEISLRVSAVPIGTKIFRRVTLLGQQGVVVLGVIVGVFLVVRKRWIHVGLWGFTLIGSELLNLWLKAVISRPAPGVDDPVLTPPDFSFPSGHAMLTLIAYGMLTYFLWREQPTWRVRLTMLVGVIALALLVGFSRLYLDTHYFSDVLGGFALGVAWLSLCILCAEVIRMRPDRNLTRPDIQVGM